MKLHILRQHYVQRTGVWVPKQSFKSKDEIKEQLGFNLDMCNIYECTVCSALHISTVRK